ncbi:MAG TPA: hypothetical protein PLE45_05550 [Spirochaetota bacterium]|nr:hypothetical protein [Spirochaetota bacterium]HOL56528.1 hypothetical protein [Spirochaetota bacterium]HPP03628.1 hypothetical protein [Spirochaetota bacterium]
MNIKIKDGFNPEKIKEKVIFTDISIDISSFTEEEKKIVAFLMQASDLIQEIFYLQKYKDNLLIKKEIEKIDIPYLKEYFTIMNGPFDAYNNNEPYIEEFNNKNIYDNEKANFYPEDLSIEEWNDFLNNNPELKDEFIFPYTIIVRENGKLKAVKYSDYYKEYLSKISELLFEASNYTNNFSLKSYLTSQANAFLNNDFYEADIRWLQIEDSNIEPLLGAHEFYEDRFLGYKASFTAFISIIKKDENKKLEFIEKLLDKLQSNLPLPDYCKKFKRGSQSQIKIVDLIYSSGDARGPFQTIAFNLPNSQKIKKEFGSKKVLLYNIIEAKFNNILMPIARRVLTEKEILRLSFPANFNLILFHEISHELGISFIKDSDGTQREVSYYLKELYPIIEETKADVMGIYLLSYFLKECFISDCSIMEVCTTYIMGLLRSIRFGKENVYCISSIIQWNFLKKEDVLITLNNNKFSIDLHKFEKTIEKLLNIILTLQKQGDYDKCDIFIKEYSKIESDLEIIINSLKDLPIDIYPSFKINM